MMYEKVIRAATGISDRSQDGFTMGMTVRTYKVVDVFVRVKSTKETGRRLWKRGEEVSVPQRVGWDLVQGGGVAHFCGIPS
jgi:hypothetical protein